MLCSLKSNEIKHLFSCLCEVYWDSLDLGCSCFYNICEEYGKKQVNPFFFKITWKYMSWSPSTTDFSLEIYSWLWSIYIVFFGLHVAIVKINSRIKIYIYLLIYIIRVLSVIYIPVGTGCTIHATPVFPSFISRLILSSPWLRKCKSLKPKWTGKSMR